MFFSGEKYISAGSEVLGKTTANPRYDLLRGGGRFGSGSNHLQGNGQVGLDQILSFFVWF
jgi:hypothetical protein